MRKAIRKIKKRYQSFKEHPLTKDSPLAALVRYLRFNIVQGLFPKPRVYQWIEPLKFYAEKGDSGIVANIYIKMIDYEESMFLMRYLQPGELFVDVGANVGRFSLLAAGKCQAQCMAIEPIPATFDKLQANMKLNKLEEKVDCLNLGVGDKESTLNFIKNRAGMNRVAIEGDTDTISVPVTTLDQLLKDKQPVFMKMDVEGFEYPALQGAQDVLANPSLKYLLLEFNNSGVKFGYEDDAVFKLIQSFGFTPFQYDVARDKILPQTHYNRDKFNTLFMRPGT